MMRPLVSYADLAERHGRKPALKLLHQLEQIAKIESETVTSMDLNARFDRALKIIKNSKHTGFYA